MRTSRTVRAGAPVANAISRTVCAPDADGIPNPDGQEFFDRAAAAGSIELSLDPDGREGRTWYGSTNPRVSQLDHTFADAETAATLRSFRIDPYPVEVLGLSDHAPMILASS
jgi:hypothetical protein